MRTGRAARSRSRRGVVPNRGGRCGTGGWGIRTTRCGAVRGRIRRTVGGRGPGGGGQAGRGIAGTRGDVARDGGRPADGCAVRRPGVLPGPRALANSSGETVRSRRDDGGRGTPSGSGPTPLRPGIARLESLARPATRDLVGTRRLPGATVPRPDRLERRDGSGDRRRGDRPGRIPEVIGRPNGGLPTLQRGTRTVDVAEPMRRGGFGRSGGGGLTRLTEPGCGPLGRLPHLPTAAPVPHGRRRRLTAVERVEAGAQPGNVL